MFRRFLALCAMLVALTFMAGSVGAAETIPPNPTHPAAMHPAKHRVHKKGAVHKKHTQRHHKRQHIAKKAKAVHHKMTSHKKKAAQHTAMHSLQTQ